MRLGEPICASWKAELALAFERRDGRTVLARRHHAGPLQVQKPLYPEGDAVCHAMVLHPPAGIAGGDQLRIAVAVDAQAHALLTTPGAGKWYRSAGPWAGQDLSFHVDGSLEWLPQETIVFDGALARMSTTVELAPDASYLGWEILCLGRSGSGERFARGACRIATEIRRAGRLLWLERGRVDGGGALLDSPAGFGGHTVCATLLATGEIDSECVAECRRDPEVALTRLPGLLVARYLGNSSEQAKRCLTRLWSLLRPVLIGRVAVEPRIWKT